MINVLLSFHFSVMLKTTKVDKKKKTEHLETNKVYYYFFVIYFTVLIKSLLQGRYNLNLLQIRPFNFLYI